MRLEQQATSPENPHVPILDLVLFCPKAYFIVVKYARQCHQVKLDIFPPDLHMKFIKFGATVI